MRLPNLSIAAKLYAIFALLATVSVMLAAVAAIGAHRHAALTREFGAEFSNALAVERINGLVHAAEEETRGIHLSPDADTIRKAAAELAVINGQLIEVMDKWRSTVSARDAIRFQNLLGRVQAFRDFRRELGRRAATMKPEEVREWAANERNAITRTTLTNELEAAADFYAQNARAIYGKVEAGASFVAWLVTVLGVLPILLAAVGACIIRYAVAKPLGRITRITEAIAAGEPGQSVPFSERRDEVGALARSIVVFEQAMRQNEDLSHTVLTDAQARTRRQEQIAAEIVLFGGDMEASLAELRRICDEMNAASERLGEAADSAASRTAGAAHSSREASANVRDIASAADELAASVGEIDRQVAQSNDIAAKAVAEAEWTNATVKELNEAAGRIGDVVRLITDIAEQTNLLALNATIEAARAGEAGRGFAVVASEVKALASQTARATEEISAQISGMQQATGRSINAISAIELTIREIGTIISTIAAAVTEQGAATQEIARSVDIAAQRTAETAGEVARVGEATAATRVNAGAVRSVAADLGGVAGRVRGQADQFFQKLRAV